MLFYGLCDNRNYHLVTNYTNIFSRVGCTKNNKNTARLNNLAPIIKYLRFKNQGQPEAPLVPFAPALSFKNGLSAKLP